MRRDEGPRGSTAYGGPARLRVGIPRALAFYRHFPFWRAFLEGCGCEVVASPPTDLGIMRAGTERCVDDICVAVKALFGHAAWLSDKVDLVLVPRMVSVEKKPYDTFTCPKLIAAPDMIRHGIPDMPELLEFVVDVKKRPWWWGCLSLGRRLGATPCRLWGAWRRGMEEQARYETLLRTGMMPEDALAVLEGKGPGTPAYLEEGRVTVGLVGHHYLLGDPLVNNRIVRWLHAAGARVVGSSCFTWRETEEEAGELPPLSWSYEKELLGAVSRFMRGGEVDGVVYMTSFGCGPDSMVMEMVRREMRSRWKLPLLEIVLDEHSAEAGIRTRAEAFVDSLPDRGAAGRRPHGERPFWGAALVVGRGERGTGA